MLSDQRPLAPGTVTDDMPPSGWPAHLTWTPLHTSAYQFLKSGKGNLLITGRAGTGKSTLLGALRQVFPGDHIVLAPTGLAAVNAGGQTIHSFFYFPPRLIGPADIKRSRNGSLMRRLKLLIIDEVSMVRSDLMWAIDQALRINRGRPREPFGGVRLLLVGDPHQLPPVVQEAEVAGHLDENFGGPYFFSCPALTEGDGTALIELDRVFRQNDSTLVGVLEHVRNGSASQSDLTVLNDCVKPMRTLAEAEGYVILVPTNAQAKRINAAYLEALPGREQSFAAALSGETSESAYPTEPALSLKVNARVMLLRNDPDRRWVNGTIAIVTRLEPGRIWIAVNGIEYELERAAWEFKRYALDKDSGKIAETIAGTFKQFPIRLAWALTIHKAQGLTLDKVYIDLGRGTFAHGQAYVALSRCRSLEGLALARPLLPSDIRFDSGAINYRRIFTSLH